MKSVLLIIIWLSSYHVCNAQTWDEWFDQKKTQKEYLVKQIAGFQLYLGYLKKGFEVAEKGMTAINNIKHGDINLHRDFFGSLKSINPNIKNSARVADITAMQAGIIKQYSKARRNVSESGLFGDQEASYIYNVFTNLLSQCVNNISELIMLTTANSSELKDDERLKRIDALYGDMADKYLFAQSFSRNAALLSMQRLKEKKDIQTIRDLYGIH